MEVFEGLFIDLRYAVRMLVRAPRLAATVVATLTIGIGASIALFSVVNTVLFGRIDAPAPERLVVLTTQSPQGRLVSASPAKYRHLDDTGAGMLLQTSAMRVGAINFSAAGIDEQLRHAQVTDSFFDLFGVRLIAGRGLSREDEAASAAKVTVISRSFWETRFGADPHIIGRRIMLGGAPHQIVGILDEFRFEEFGTSPDVWTPLQLPPDTRSQGHYLYALSRLAPGVSLDEARTRIRASTSAYLAQFPSGLPSHSTLDLARLEDVLVDDLRRPLTVLAVAVGLLLLIACANVTHLLLAHGEQRRNELATRMAAGASRARIARQLLTESALLVITSGLCGLLVGFMAMRALLAVNTANLPRVGDDGVLVGLDWRVAICAMALTAATTAIVGLMPALRLSRPPAFTPSKRWFSVSILAAQIALTLILLVGAGVLIQNARDIASIDLGFEYENVVTLRTSIASTRFQQAQAVFQAVEDVRAQLESTPGIETVSATCCMPLEGAYVLPFRIQGRPIDESIFHGVADWMAVSPGYFHVLRIPIVRGRAFDNRDRRGSRPVAIINETMARLFWPDGEPLENRLLVGAGLMPEFAEEHERVIVGVARDTRETGLIRGPAPAIYIPQGQMPNAVNALMTRLAPLAWLVRTNGPALHHGPFIQEVISTATSAPVTAVRPMKNLLAQTTSRQRFHMLLMSAFGLAALALTGIGVYGMLAYMAGRRRRELAIRAALGADAIRIRRLVAGPGILCVSAGVVIGLAIATGFAHVIDALVLGVRANDRTVFALSTMFLLSISALAVLIPAGRAVRGDIVAALRTE